MPTPVDKRFHIAEEGDHSAFTTLYRDAGLEIEEDWPSACHAVFSVSAREENGALLGAATLSRRFRRWVLDYIAVRPEARFLGVGRRLAEACLGYVRERGGKELWLAARTPGFFHALGAEDTGGDLLLGECLGCPDYQITCSPKEMKFVI